MFHGGLPRGASPRCHAISQCGVVCSSFSPSSVTVMITRIPRPLARDVAAIDASSRSSAAGMTSARSRLPRIKPGSLAIHSTKSSTSGSARLPSVPPVKTRKRPAAARQQQPASVNDVIAGNRGDQPPRQVRNCSSVMASRMRAPAWCRSSTRRQRPSESRIERGGLIDDAAE